MKAPNPVMPDENVQDIFTERSLGAGLGVDLGISHAGRIAKQVLPHISSGDQVRLTTTFVPVKTAQDIRFRKGRTIRFQSDVIVSKNRARDCRVVFNLGPDVLFLQPPQNLEVPLRRVSGWLGR